MLNESNKIRVGNTIRVVWLLLVVYFSSLYFVVPNNIIFLKLIVVPMFWLSTLGLKALYKNPIETQAVFSGNVIEYNALYGLVFGGFLTLVMWTPSVTVSKLFLGLIVAVVMFVPLGLLVHHRELKRNT